MRMDLLNEQRPYLFAQYYYIDSPETKKIDVNDS